eukprot:941884_1
MRAKKPSSFECVKCQKSFPARISLRKHLDACGKISVKKYKCDECTTTCEMRNQLDTHMAEVHKGYKCKNCERRFPLVGMADAHLKNNSCNKYKCNQCEMKFWNPSLREAHVMEIHGGHKCVKCKGAFNSLATLTKHLKTISCEQISDAKLVKCPNKQRKRSLKNEALMHQCSECEEKVQTVRSLVIHMREAHGGFKCDTCVPVRRFYNVMTLKRHTDKNRCMKWKCTECALSFQCLPLLDTHMKDVHGGSKCPRCHKRFNKILYLNHHRDRILCTKIETDSNVIG